MDEWTFRFKDFNFAAKNRKKIKVGQTYFLSKISCFSIISFLTKKVLVYDTFLFCSELIICLLEWQSNSIQSYENKNSFYIAMPNTFILDHLYVSYQD